MRKGFDGLAVLVQQSLKQSPHSGALFAFRGRRGDLMKLGASKNPSASRADLIHWFRGRIGCVRWNYSGFRLS
jgi:transposase